MGLATRHPHIVKNLRILWGTKECKEYLEGLITPSRPNRQGFEFQILIEILDFAEQHKQEFPKLYRTDVWDIV